MTKKFYPMSRLSNKKGRKSNYSKSLNNDYHKEVRRKALLRDNFKCKICSSVLFLELHHIAYYIDGLTIVGIELEFMPWVVILCCECHQKVHNDKTHYFNPVNVNKKQYNFLL